MPASPQVRSGHRRASILLQIDMMAAPRLDGAEAGADDMDLPADIRAIS
jgi:hypothetical protein